jgi:hypothetical protein
MRVLSWEAARLLETLKAAGVRCRLNGEKVTVEHDGQLTDGVRRLIRRLKPELVELLKAGEGDWVRESEWTFKQIRIPNQTHPGQVDVWLCGWNHDGSVIRWSFVETERQDE